MADRAESSRAESVRARRQKRDRRKPEAAQPQAAAGKTAQSAPVFMRGAKVDVPVQRRKKASVRRRFDISLRSPGAEVQLPAVPFLRPNWRWLSGLLAVGLGVLLGAFWSSPLFQVEAIAVEGLLRLEAREVNMVLGAQGIPVFALDPAQMEHDLALAFPEFMDVRVGVGLPNTVRIRVTERQPVLGWLNPQGLVLVDANGISFPARGLVNDQGVDTAADGTRMPVVEAPNMVMLPEEQAPGAPPLNPYVGRRLLTPRQVEGLLQLSQGAPADAELIFDPERGMGWREHSGRFVYFGASGEDIPVKLHLLAMIVLQLEEDNIAPAMISVEYLHAPYYRMER